MTGDASPVRRLPKARLANLIASATYGTVLVLASLTVVGTVQVSVGYGAELIAGVGLATWVAHLYAELLGDHVRLLRPLQVSQVKRAAIDGCPILVSPVLPACVLMLGKLDTVAEDTARTAAIVVALVQLLAIGVFVGRVAPARSSALWVFASVTVGIGLTVVTVTTWSGH